MEFNFLEAMRTVKPGAILTAINAARPSGDYLLASLLPNVNRGSYQAKTGGTRVVATMAGLTAMDSPYVKGGSFETFDFSEETLKISTETDIKEQQLREIQEYTNQLVLQGLRGNTRVGPLDALVEEIFNFTDKLLVQPVLDREEWMRGQALFTGGILWTQNGKKVTVDYQVPSTNVLTIRTGTDAYHGSTSKFWSDMLLQERILGNVRARIVHPDTIAAIIDNPANSLVVTNKVKVGNLSTVYTLRKINQNTGQYTTDAGDQLEIISYRGGGSVYDPANLGRTLKVPFTVRGVVLAIGDGDDQTYQVASGADDLPPGILGVTHIAPTTENNGVSGRWGRTYVPEAEPWMLRGQSVENIIPLIDNPNLICRSNTEMPA